MRISDWSSDVCFSDLTQLRLDSGATQPNIAFYNGSGDAEDRNWAIVASHDGYGDLCFRRSNAAGGDPLTAGTTIFRILPHGQWQGVNGTSAAPAYSFAADADTGFMLRSEEHTSALQSLMRISSAVFCLTKKKHHKNTN